MLNRYQAILADCPWRYEQCRIPGSAEKHYSTMSVDELCALPVADLAADDSILFLWTTYPMLSEALRIVDEWGFRYVTVAFTWVKKNKKADSFFLGMGFWTRSNAEICLLATTGHPKRVSKSVRQLIVSPIERHSKKPDETRERIVELLGDVPRIELFAREKTPRWDCWGNEIDSDIIL